MIFEKMVVLPLYKNDEKSTKEGNVLKLQKILAEKYKLEINGSEE